MYYFCTYFDQHYLPRGLALHASLMQHVAHFRLFILCLDRQCYRQLQARKLANVELILLDQLERADSALAESKHNRSRIEYYFTCTPAFTLYVFEQFPEVDLLTYVDADMYFFNDPAPAFREIGAASVAITSHRYAPQTRDLYEYGEYNVGWLSFRRDTNGLACLRWYRERCIEWCYDRLEDGRYADQKYLEDMPALFSGVVVLNHPGVNTAPWNLANYHFHRKRNRVFVDDMPLIIFHFHGFKQKLSWLFDTHTARYQTWPSPVVRKHVYGVYLETLLPLLRQNQLVDGIRVEKAQRSAGQQALKAYRVFHYLRGIALGQYLVCNPLVGSLAKTMLSFGLAIQPHVAQLGPIWSLQAAEILQFI